MDRAWFHWLGWVWRPVAPAGWLVTALTVALCGWVLWAADRHAHSVRDTLLGAFPYAGPFVVFWGFVAARTSPGVVERGRGGSR